MFFIKVMDNNFLPAYSDPEDEASLCKLLHRNHSILERISPSHS